MTTDTILSPKAVAREYFHRLDAGDPSIVDLFARDASFYFPKYGLGRGPQQLLEMMGRLGDRVQRIEHNVLSAFFLQDGDQVVVEGTSRGVLRDGRTWTAGETPAGRFCNVFEIRDGKIVRLAVYLDPDYGGDDEAGFLWGREGRRW
jgi:ketosteroid isomerase-like protein